MKIINIYIYLYYYNDYYNYTYNLYIYYTCYVIINGELDIGRVWKVPHTTIFFTDTLFHTKSFIYLISRNIDYD